MIKNFESLSFEWDEFFLPWIIQRLELSGRSGQRFKIHFCRDHLTQLFYIDSATGEVRENQPFASVIRQYLKQGDPSIDEIRLYSEVDVHQKSKDKYYEVFCSSELEIDKDKDSRTVAIINSLLIEWVKYCQIMGRKFTHEQSSLKSDSYTPTMRTQKNSIGELYEPYRSGEKLKKQPQLDVSSSSLVFVGSCDVSSNKEMVDEQSESESKLTVEQEMRIAYLKEKKEILNGHYEAVKRELRRDVGVIRRRELEETLAQLQEDIDQIERELLGLGQGNE